jgi:class 3 adenylate cyclase
MDSDVEQWLAALDLAKYRDAFAENEIAFGDLGELTEDDLKEMGLPIGPRRRALKAIAALVGLPNPGPDVLGGEARERPESTAPAERRQLTVMFCDLVGSTALSATLDPEDYRNVMRNYQETVAGAVGRYDGHVAKYLGDGVLIYFGWPHAHEDDAERAVRAGLEAVNVVAALTPMADLKLDARVGIATGLVIAGDLVGEGVTEEGAVSGETPNLAARLQELASPGAVVVAEATMHLLGEVFDRDDLGAHELKGLTEPVRAWRITGARKSDSRFEASRSGRLTPFVGREHEIELLFDRWARVKEGEGQIVLLSGEAGIGKSRISRALNERLESEQLIRLRYQCSPHYQSTALHPFIVQLEHAADFLPRDDAAAKLDKIERLLKQGTDDVLGSAPFVAGLLSVPTGDRYAPLKLTPQRQKERTLQVLLDQLMGLTAQRPVVMIFEDVHWADPTTLTLLEQAIDGAQDARILVVITSRPEFQATWAGHTHVTTLTLNRLTRAQCSALVERVSAGKAMPPAVLDQVVAKTDGVPLFVEELTKTVLESGLLSETDDGSELTGPLPPLAIPATLHDSLMARLDRLGPSKEIAQTGAAIGREFPHRLLAAVSGKDDEALDDALAQLVDAELLFRRGAHSETRYVFKHALVQDAAYESLLLSNRKELHRRIAEAYRVGLPETTEVEPEILAHHYTEAGNVESAIEFWRQAGERAAERSANHEAIVHLERALALLDEISDDRERDSKELDLRLLLGGSRLMAKGHGAPEVEQAYGRALDLCRKLGETSRLVRTLFGLWRSHIVVPDYQSCLDLGRQLIEHGSQCDDPVARMLGHHCIAFPRFMLGDNKRARKDLDAALEFYHPDQRGSPVYRQGQDPAEACFVYRALVLWVLGFHDTARASAAEGIALAESIADPFTRAHGHTFHAVLDYLCRDRESQGHNAASAVRIATEYGFTLWEVWGGFHSHWLDVEADPERGIEELRANLQALEDIPMRALRSLHHGMLAETYVAAGWFDGALAEIKAGDAVVEVLNERFWEAELRRLEGTILLVRDNDAKTAASCFERAIEIARQQQARSLELRAATSLARLWRDAGNRTEAYDLLAPIHAWFTEGHDTEDLKDAKLLLDGMS